MCGQFHVLCILQVFVVCETWPHWTRNTHCGRCPNDPRFDNCHVKTLTSKIKRREKIPRGVEIFFSLFLLFLFIYLFLNTRQRGGARILHCFCKAFFTLHSDSECNTIWMSWKSFIKNSWTIHAVVCVYFFASFAKSEWTIQWNVIWLAQVCVQSWAQVRHSPWKGGFRKKVVHLRRVLFRLTGVDHSPFGTPCTAPCSASGVTSILGTDPSQEIFRSFARVLAQSNVYIPVRAQTVKGQKMFRSKQNFLQNCFIFPFIWFTIRTKN